MVELDAEVRRTMLTHVPDMSRRSLWYGVNTWDASGSS